MLSMQKMPINTDAERHGDDLIKLQARTPFPTPITPARDLQKQGAQSCSYLSLRELLLQFLYFLTQFPDDFGVGVLIHDGMVNNPLGSICIS